MSANDSQLGDARDRVGVAILGYLVSHPEAKDTLQGVLEWWVPQGGGRAAEHEAEEALRHLMSQGWVTAEKRGSSAVLYGLREDRKASIRELLLHLSAFIWRTFKQSTP